MGAIRRRVVADPQDRELVIHSQQDVEDILASNRALYNAERRTTALNPGDGWRMVARIPLLEIERLRALGADFYDPNDEKVFRKILNDPDYRAWRTAPGRL